MGAIYSRQLMAATGNVEALMHGVRLSSVSTCQHISLAMPGAAARRLDPSVPTSWDDVMRSIGGYPGNFQADMVAGLIQGARVTLLGCTQAGFTVSSPGFECQQLFAQAILRGAALETPDEVRLRPGDRRTQPPGRVGHADRHDGDDGDRQGRPVSLTVSYRPPEKHTAEIPGGTVTLGYDWTASGNPLRQRQLEQRAALMISLDESLPLYHSSTAMCSRFETF
jgi:hypothetical protein